MEQHLDQLMSEEMPPIIKNRFCLFLAFSLDQLFYQIPKATQELLFEKILFYLVKSLSNKNKVVSLQALDTLETQVSERILT